MSVKRSRTARSSSSADVVLSRRSSPTAESPELRWAAFFGSSGAAAAAKAAKLESGRLRPGILSVSSPPVVQEEFRCEQPPVGNFLEKCHYCRKMIGEDDEVFMYGHLQAFCTSDCRDRQIAMDNSGEILSGRSGGTPGGCCKKNRN